MLASLRIKDSGTAAGVNSEPITAVVLDSLFLSHNSTKSGLHQRLSGREINDPQVTGYLHPGYAESLAEFGLPYELPRSRGWILKRKIPDYPGHDAIGCYPLFTCRDWSQLHSDLDDLSGEFVSLALVASPFGNYDPAYLKSCFPDVFVAFKEHFVVDLDLPRESFVHQHHRRNARKALREFNIEVCTEPTDFLDDWVVLYGTLVKRHAITGIAAFSEDSFRKQLAVPGIRVFRAIREGTTAGMLLWYVQGDVAYYHLGAYSGLGYELNASFALFSQAIDYFAQSGLRWLHLGAGAGAVPGGGSGLVRFKAGWATGRRLAYFCGRVFDQKKYDEVVMARRSIRTTAYFPAYRADELS